MVALEERRPEKRRTCGVNESHLALSRGRVVVERNTEKREICVFLKSYLRHTFVNWGDLSSAFFLSNGRGTKSDCAETYKGSDK